MADVTDLASRLRAAASWPQNISNMRLLSEAAGALEALHQRVAELEHHESPAWEANTRLNTALDEQIERAGKAESRVSDLEAALRQLVGSKSTHFKARNGRLCTIEDDGGEMMYLVPFDCMSIAEAVLSATPAPAAPHSDDVAVERFAVAMKEKLAKKRVEGRDGWDNPSVCTVESLAEMLIGHLPKGDTVDIGNFAMMLWNRLGGDRALVKVVTTPIPEPPATHQDNQGDH